MVLALSTCSGPFVVRRTHIDDHKGESRPRVPVLLDKPNDAPMVLEHPDSSDFKVWTPSLWSFPSRWDSIGSVFAVFPYLEGRGFWDKLQGVVLGYEVL
jgi:hypothetical protein